MSIIRKRRDIEVYPSYDRNGDPLLYIEKRRGRLTLEEIRTAARDWDEDVYALLIDARNEDEGQCFGEDPQSDCVKLYRAEQFFRRDHDE